MKSLIPYRVLWIVMIYFGATADLGFIWLLADTLNAMMAIPNLIALAAAEPHRLQTDERVLCLGRQVGRAGRNSCRVTQSKNLGGRLGPPPLKQKLISRGET